MNYNYFFITPEYGKSLVQGDHCLDKVVIVDTAHKVCQEVLSNLKNMQILKTTLLQNNQTSGLMLVKTNWSRSRTQEPVWAQLRFWKIRSEQKYRDSSSVLMENVRIILNPFYLFQSGAKHL